jgi:hypothetical protein
MIYKTGPKRRGDGRPQPGPQRQVVCIWVNPVKTLSLVNLVACQDPVYAGQRLADEVLPGGVLTGDRQARYPGQQGQPGVTGINGELAAISGDRGPGVTKGHDQRRQPPCLGSKTCRRSREPPKRFTGHSD